MRKANFLKNTTNIGYRKLIIFTGILAAVLFFLIVSQTEVGGFWFSAYNIGVCTNGADLGNPDWPIIKWDTSGAGVCKYQLQIADNPQFRNLLLDTGEQFIGFVNYFRWGTSYYDPPLPPRCPGDNDPNSFDVPGSFWSSQYLGETCYDWSVNQQLVYEPTDLDLASCWSDPNCYFSYEANICYCLSKPGVSPEQNIYVERAYSPSSQTSFAYQTYLPGGRTYYYRVNVSDCSASSFWSGPVTFLGVWSGWATDSFYAPPANNPPLVSNPRIVFGSDSCSAGVNFASATLYWDYSDPDNDQQGSFRANGSWDTGRVYSGANSYALNLACGTTYSFRVMAWDTNGLASNWTNYASYTTPPLNRPPSAYNLQVSQPGDYCSAGPNAAFSWNYTDPDGDSENSYQIQVDSDSGFAHPEADSGRVYSSSNSFSTINLGYNTTYYWRVRVWDSQGLVSSWASGPSFATPKHAYPTANFTWSPTSPSANENVSFTDQSTIYGGVGKAAWYWTFQDGNPSSSTQQNPTIKFNSQGNKQISFRVTDTDGYSCTVNRQININLPLPKWKEIIPR